LKFKYILLLLLLSVSILFFSCTDEPSSLGITQIESDFVVVKTFDSSIDTISQSSTYFKRVVPLGSSDWVMVGRHHNQLLNQDIKSSALLKFLFGLPDSIKTEITDGNINVNDAWIKLRNRYIYVDTLADMNFTVHKVNKNWTTGFTIDSLPNLDYDIGDISSNFSIDDTSYSFHIENALVLDWMKNSVTSSSATNYGIYLDPTTSSNKVVGFEAFTLVSSEAAKLTVVIEKPGAYIDTISGFISADISLIDGPVPTLPTGIIGVQSSVTIKSRLTFDLSALPSGIVVNKAELILTSDTTNSLKGSRYTNNLLAFYLSYADSLNTEGNAVILTYSDGKYSGEITSFVRGWLNREENYGLLIQPGNQLSGLDLFALKGSDNSELTNCPRLRITYTIKKIL
jgi:hypothetical protein